MKNLFLFISLLLLSVCCNPDNPSSGRKFTIHAGDHYCSPHPLEFITGSTMAFEAKFENANYDLGNSNQYDWNKLAGFADNNSLIHKHSARFAWRWNEESQSIEIAAYTYNNGSWSAFFLGNTTMGKWDKYEVYSAGNLYVYIFNGGMITVPRSAPLNGVKTKSWPYFGGDEVAPHDMYIYIKEL